MNKRTHVWWKHVFGIFCTILFAISTKFQFKYNLTNEFKFEEK